MSITTVMLDPRTRRRIIRAAVAAALALPVAAIASGTVWSGFGLATVPSAVIVSTLVDPARAGRVQTIVRAAAWGIGTGLISTVLLMAATFVGAILGFVPNTPETPLGYVLILILTVVSITPFLAARDGLRNELRSPDHER